MGLAALCWTKSSFSSYISIFTIHEWNFFSSPILTLSYNVMRNLSIYFLNYYSFCREVCTSSSKHLTWVRQRDFTWTSFQMNVLCTPQASRVPARGRFCHYSSLSPLQQQGLEHFSTAFALANTHQENRSKWRLQNPFWIHLQNQMSVPRSSQQDSSSAMMFLLFIASPSKALPESLP